MKSRTSIFFQAAHDLLTARTTGYKEIRSPLYNINHILRISNVGLDMMLFAAAATTPSGIARTVLDILVYTYQHASGSCVFWALFVPTLNTAFAFLDSTAPVSYTHLTLPTKA